MVCFHNRILLKATPLDNFARDRTRRLSTPDVVHALVTSVRPASIWVSMPLAFPVSVTTSVDVPGVIWMLISS